MMFSEYHNDWALSMKKMISHHESQYEKYINTDIESPVDLLHKKHMKVFQSARKLYLFINRTKLQYFSFQPRLLKFWRTITRKRNEFINLIDNKSIRVYNDKERKYLMLFRKTLEKYDPTYGLQIGLLLRVKFNRDVSLVINEYLM